MAERGRAGVDNYCYMREHGETIYIMGCYSVCGRSRIFDDCYSLMRYATGKTTITHMYYYDDDDIMTVVTILLGG